MTAIPIKIAVAILDFVVTVAEISLGFSFLLSSTISTSSIASELYLCYDGNKEKIFIVYFLLFPSMFVQTPNISSS